MKKTYILTLVPLLLMGCTHKTYDLDLKVICPSGAPSLAFYKYANDALFETNTNVNTITGYLTGSSNYDVVVVDTTSGLNAIKSGANYKMAATITLGNFYIASTSSENNTLDKEDTIVLFGNNNAIPYKIFTYLYGTDFNIEFCGGGVDKAAYALQTGINPATSHKADWVFIAEPLLNAAQNNENSILKGKKYPVINVQQEYKVKTDGLPLMQASVFVNADSDQTKVTHFLEQLKSDIEKAIEIPSLMVDGMNQLSSNESIQAKFGVSTQVVEKVMQDNKIGLSYLNAKENKTAIDTYISLFGLGSTDEKIYF